MASLTDWLTSIRDRKRAPGVFDCCTLPCDWAVFAGFPDPMAKWRGAYCDDDGAHEFIAAAGSLEALFVEGFGGVGIPFREGDPLPGDVGLIRVGEGEAGSVFTGKRWLFVGTTGVGAASVDPEAIVKVWAVGNG